MLPAFSYPTSLKFAVLNDFASYATRVAYHVPISGLFVKCVGTVKRFKFFFYSIIIMHISEKKLTDVSHTEDISYQLWSIIISKLYRYFIWQLIELLLTSIVAVPVQKSTHSLLTVTISSLFPTHTTLFGLRRRHSQSAGNQRVTANGSMLGVHSAYVARHGPIFWLFSLPRQQ